MFCTWSSWTSSPALPGEDLLRLEMLASLRVLRRGLRLVRRVWGCLHPFGRRCETVFLSGRVWGCCNPFGRDCEVGTLGSFSNYCMTFIDILADTSIFAPRGGMGCSACSSTGDLHGHLDHLLAFSPAPSWTFPPTRPHWSVLRWPHGHFGLRANYMYYTRPSRRRREDEDRTAAPAGHTALRGSCACMRPSWTALCACRSNI
jgi:hypothetical protein